METKEVDKEKRQLESQLKKKDEIEQLLDNYSPKYAISDLKL